MHHSSQPYRTPTSTVWSSESWILRCRSEIID